VDKDSPDGFKKNGESPNHNCIVDDNILESRLTLGGAMKMSYVKKIELSFIKC
jgi:hypothetical protein